MMFMVDELGATDEVDKIEPFVDIDVEKASIDDGEVTELI
jgi:hypothetical protein